MKNFASIVCASILLIPLVPLKSNADDLSSYWLGFGIGATATLCSLEKVGLLTNEKVEEFMMGMRQGFAEQKDRSKLNMDMFNRGVQVTRDGHPTCKI